MPDRRPPDLLTKWIELAAFQPIDRDHSAKGTRMHEVWVDGPEQEDIRRRFIEERYRLMPYLYTDGRRDLARRLAHRPAAVSGVSPRHRGWHSVRPDYGWRRVSVRQPHPGGAEPLAGRGGALRGASAARDSGTTTGRGEQVGRSTLAGTLDLEQRDKVIAQKPLMVTPTLERLPVYVRGGSILPIAPLTQSTAEVPKGPLTLRVFPLDAAAKSDETCGGEVYTDDGHTFDFRGGAFARIHFSCALAADGALQVEIAKQEGNWQPWWKQYRIEVMNWTPKQKRASVDGKTVAIEPVEGRWGVTAGANAAGLHILLQ